MTAALARRHGDHASYNAGCHCPACRAGNAAYQRARRQTFPRGRTPGGWVDAAPVRAHVEQLRAAGLGRREIAARAGIDPSLVFVLVNGRDGRPPSLRVAAGTARRLLEVPVPAVDEVALGTQISGVGARRRLRALVAIGWSQDALARQLELSPENLGRLINGDGRKVTVRTHRRVVEVYDRLSMNPPRGAAADAARAFAAARRWPSPLAWDDDTIDDSNVRASRGVGLRHHVGTAFDEVAVERAMRGDPVALRPAERGEAIRRLTARGLGSRQIAVLLGVTPRSVVRRRGEAA